MTDQEMSKADKAYKKYVKPAGIGMFIYGAIVPFVAAFSGESTFNYFPMPFFETLFAKRVTLALLAPVMLILGFGLIKKQFWGWIGMLALVIGFPGYLVAMALLGHMAGAIPFGLSPMTYAIANVIMVVLGTWSIYAWYKPVFVPES
ncbi:MAG: hypothetical protein JRH15_13595 [Deltaproteobacteria bacterium]|nr:hypothetical protein [Deltaproteobacteria bacterium]